MDLHSIIEIGTAVSIVGAIVGGAWKIVRKLDRILFTLEEYPPHRHNGVKIEYPTSYSPGRSDNMERTGPMDRRSKAHG